MASVSEPLRRSPFANEPRSFRPQPTRTLPILSSTPSAATKSGDKMEVAQPQVASMGPPQSSPNGDRQSEQNQSEHSGQNGQNGASGQLVGAAAAAQQPKVVQTAFIHKLYKFVLSGYLHNRHLLTMSQYVGRPDHPTPHLVVKHQRELRYVAIFRILKSSCVRSLNRFGFEVMLIVSGNISNIPTFLHSCDSLTCTASTKVRYP